MRECFSILQKVFDLICGSIWSRFEKYYPFQVGGQELAAVPLATAIALKGLHLGKPINYFIIRKSRKKVGLQNLIEGELNSEKIVLVDDLLNSGDNQFYAKLKRLKIWIKMLVMFFP